MWKQVIGVLFPTLQPLKGIITPKVIPLQLSTTQYFWPIESRGLPDIIEARRQLCVFNTNRPVHLEVGIRITITLTITVSVVYHRFGSIPKVQTQYAPPVSNLRHFLVHIPNYKLISSRKRYYGARLQPQIEFISNYDHTNVRCSTLHLFRNISSIYIQPTSVSVRKNDHRVQGWNPLSIFFENLTQRCMVDRKTISRLVHYTLIIFLYLVFGSGLRAQINCSL